MHIQTNIYKFHIHISHNHAPAKIQHAEQLHLHSLIWNQSEPRNSYMAVYNLNTWLSEDYKINIYSYIIFSMIDLLSSWRITGRL